MGAGAAVLGLWDPVDLTVQEDLPGFRDLHGAGADIIRRLVFAANGFQLAAHDAGGNEGNHQADDQGNHQTKHYMKGFFRQVVSVKGITVSGLRDEFVAFYSENIKGRGVVFITKLANKLLAQILDACIRKGGDAVAAGGDPPIPVLHAHQQQNTVLVEAVEIVKIVGICHGGLTLQRIRGDYHHIHSLPGADFVQLFQ